MKNDCMFTLCQKTHNDLKQEMKKKKIKRQKINKKTQTLPKQDLNKSISCLLHVNLCLGLDCEKDVTGGYSLQACSLPPYLIYLVSLEMT